MPAFPREELEEMVQRWLDINRRCEEQLRLAADGRMYTEDATYGWNVGPNDEFMAVGRDEIREHRPGPGDGRAGGMDLSRTNGC